MPISSVNTALTEKNLRFKPEGQYLERKGRDAKPTKIANELIGMLNAGGGTFVYGIRDNGEIENLQDTTHPNLDRYRSLVHDFIHPPVRIELEEIHLEGGALVFLYHVDQDHERLFQRKDNEEVFLRVADTNRKLNRDEVKALEYNKQIRKFEDEPRPDFDPDDLDPATCSTYSKAIQFKGTFEELALKRFLATRKDGRTIYKNGAILLFSQNPEKYIPNASVRYVRYQGDAQKSGKEFNVIKDQRFESNIPDLIETLDNFIEASLRDYYFLDMEQGVFRRVPEFPRDAWLEGIINALCHRSYNIQGNPVLIKHFDNRLEISNSGPLPAQVTVENIKRERFARNPRIARVLFDLGYVRELNEGVPRIYDAMDTLSLAQPEYTDHANTVKLTLRNKVTEHDQTIISNVFDALESIWSGLNDTQRRIIQHLLHNQQATVAELSDTIGVGAPAIRYNLKKLIGHGILERQSKKLRDANAIYRFQSG